MALKKLHEVMSTPLAYNGHPRLTLAFLVAAAALTPMVTMALAAKFTAMALPPEAATFARLYGETLMAWGAVAGLEGGWHAWRKNAWLTAPRPEAELRP